MSSFSKQLSTYEVSQEYCQLDVVAARVTIKTKTNKAGEETKEKVFKEVNKAKTDVLTVRLTASDLGQQLSFFIKRGGNEEDAKDECGRLLATFTVTKTFELSMTSTDEFNKISSYVYKPLLTTFPGIEAPTLSKVFGLWLCTPVFFEHLKILAAEGAYTPALVKMIILFVSYREVKQRVMEDITGQFTKDMPIDVQEVMQVFRDNMIELKAETPKMSKHYSTELVLAPATPATKQLEPTTKSLTEPDQVSEVAEPLTDSSEEETAE